MDTEKDLDYYAELTERLQFLQASQSELKDKAIPIDVRDALKEIEEEYKPLIDDIVAKIEAVKASIETAVLETKTTAHGNKYMAVYVSGKTSWNGKALEGFAMAHPEILQARSLGKPSVTFRKVK